MAAPQLEQIGGGLGVWVWMTLTTTDDGGGGCCLVFRCQKDATSEMIEAPHIA
ncbi:MAG: hypothetical protein QXF45_08300 [Candidatus Caldarchaeum sp.]